MSVAEEVPQAKEVSKARAKKSHRSNEESKMLGHVGEW